MSALTSQLKALQAQCVAVVEMIEGLLEKEQAEEGGYPVPQGCQHPDAARMHIKVMGEPSRWRCMACGHEGGNSGAEVASAGAASTQHTEEG